MAKSAVPFSFNFHSGRKIASIWPNIYLRHEQIVSIVSFALGLRQLVAATMRILAPIKPFLPSAKSPLQFGTAYHTRIKFHLSQLEHLDEVRALKKNNPRARGSEESVQFRAKKCTEPIAQRFYD